MLKEYKEKTNIGIGLGLLLKYGSVAVSNNPLFISLSILAGVILFIYGCSSYAKGKGYSSILGVLGLFSVVGLIALAVFPDKYKKKEKNIDKTNIKDSRYCNKCGYELENNSIFCPKCGAKI